MKFLKKVVSVILALMLIISMPMSVLATEDEGSETFYIGEDQMISELQDMSDNELLELGYTYSEIAQIREFDYFKALEERASLDDETLRLYRYTPEEIEELRDYVSSGRFARKTISTNTLTIKLKFEKTKTGKQANCIISWEWKRAALCKFIDCVAVAWKTTNGATINYIPNDKNKVTVTWTKINPNSTDSYQKKSSAVWIANNNESIFSRVAMGSSNYFAYSGEGTFTMKATSGTFKEFYIDYGYAHYTISIKPNISVSPKGTGVSISFKGGTTDQQHIKRLYNASFGIVAKY